MEARVPDAAKILYDLESLTKALDMDRDDLAKLAMSGGQRKDMQHHVARCLHSLRELEFALEAQDPGNDLEADFPV
jgi:hypothetical protein